MLRRRPGRLPVEEETGVHGQRPWVYFMIDCFLLMVQFFVLTFKFKSEEAILPNRLPPGSITITSVEYDPRPVLHVAVSRPAESAQVVYEYLSRRVTLAELARTLAGGSADAGNYRVRVSYGEEVAWADVLAVFNECARARITDCGLVTGRGLLPGRRS